MTEFGSEPTFRTYLQILRRRKWWVCSIAVLGLSASLAFSLTAHKQYSATAQLLVQPSFDPNGLDAVQEEPVTQTDVETELQLVTSAPVQQAVRSRLGSTPTVSAAEVGQTNVIAITAISLVPSQAALIANLYATDFVQYRQAVASGSLATAEAQLRSQISSLGQQLGPLQGATTSPEASALANQEAVLKEQLAQMEVSLSSRLSRRNAAPRPSASPAARPSKPSCTGLGELGDTGICAGVTSATSPVSTAPLTCICASCSFRTAS